MAATPCVGGTAPGLADPVFDLAHLAHLAHLGTGGMPFDLRDDTAAFIGSSGLSGPPLFGEDRFDRLCAVGIHGVVVRRQRG